MGSGDGVLESLRVGHVDRFEVAPDPAPGIPASDQRALADRHTGRREDLVKTLQADAMDLVELRRGTQTWRDGLGRAHEELHRRLARLCAGSEG